MIVIKTGMDNSPGIRFENILINMDESKSLTKINQLKKPIQDKKGGAGTAPAITYGLPQNIFLWGLHK